MHRRNIILIAGAVVIVVIVALLTGGEDELEPPPPSTANVNEVVVEIRSTLEEQGLNVMLISNHSANAARFELELRPTQLILFGTTGIGTALMQEQRTIGIDLPSKILVWEDESGEVRVAYNSPDYLKARHGVESVDELLSDVDAVMTRFHPNMLGIEFIPTEGQGLITIPSTRSVDETVAALETILEDAGFSIPLVFNHSDNAARVGQILKPTVLIIFGNPNVGTQLMQNQQSIGIDLPQKFLVWEAEDGQVNITYNDPFFLAERHGITGMDELLTNMSNALANFARQGAGTPPTPTEAPVEEPASERGDETPQESDG